MPAARLRAKRVPAHARRASILDAAVAVFAAKGFHAASTAEIAARLRVSEPTIFRHFPTKRALYLAAIDRSAERALERWDAIAAETASPSAALLEMGRWYFAELARDPSELLLRFRSYGEAGDAEIGTRVRLHFRRTRRLVERLLGAARDCGEIDASADVRAHAWLFMAVGALLDATELVGLRRDLALADMPGVMAAAMPRPSR